MLRRFPREIQRAFALSLVAHGALFGLAVALPVDRTDLLEPSEASGGSAIRVWLAASEGWGDLAGQGRTTTEAMPAHEEGLEPPPTPISTQIAPREAESARTPPSEHRTGDRSELTPTEPAAEMRREAPDPPPVPAVPAAPAPPAAPSTQVAAAGSSVPVEAPATSPASGSAGATAAAAVRGSGEAGREASGVAQPPSWPGPGEVDRVARPRWPIRPVYPSLARRAGKEAMVVVAAWIDAGGKVATVRRIDREEIREDNARSLDEAMVHIPNVVVRTGGDGVPRIDVRGLRSRQLTLLIDGVPFNSTADGQFDPTLVPTYLIDRVDLVTSNSSVLYGDGGIAGVLQIRTRPMTEALDATVSMDVREREQFQPEATVSGSRDRVEAFLGGRYLDSQGYEMSNSFNGTAIESGGLCGNSYREQGSFFGKLGFARPRRCAWACSATTGRRSSAIRPTRSMIRTIGSRRAAASNGSRIWRASLPSSPASSNRMVRLPCAVGATSIASTSSAVATTTRTTTRSRPTARFASTRRRWSAAAPRTAAIPWPAWASFASP